MARKQGYNLEIVENVIVVHAKLIIHQRACGVVGSASALQAEGHRFDSGLVHFFSTLTLMIWLIDGVTIHIFT